MGERGFENLIHHFEFPTKYHEFSLLAKAFCPIEKKFVPFGGPNDITLLEGEMFL